MAFGEILRQKRRAAHLTMEALAAAVGTTRQTIYRYESGIIQTPPYDKVEALAAALLCPPAELLGWGEEPALPETLGQASAALIDEGADLTVTAMDDAMSGDRILERDTVYVRRGADGGEGGIYAVQIDGVTVLRRMTVSAAGDSVVLWASNPAFPPMVFAGEERRRLEILGRAYLLQTAL
ncbi:MAG: LexA family transcriptional regulator [Eubacteriales bacterium]|nr:LexA family transcriptional regulator [Eubacteriales bacterium]